MPIACTSVQINKAMKLTQEEPHMNKQYISNTIYIFFAFSIVVGYQLLAYGIL